MEFLYLLTGIFIGLLAAKKWVNKSENEGEYRVRETLKGFCSKSGAHLLNNITLRLDDGTTTQIDHILITRKGVLVIETKDYSGWIFGSEKQKSWTQVIYKKKSKFQNPIHQNYRHLKAVKELLDYLPSKAVKGLVVFTNKSEFQTAFPNNVIQEKSLLDFVKSFDADEISENRAQFCVGRIECKRMEISGKTDVEHQKNLERRFS